MLRDMPRTAMPSGTVYDSVDYLLDRSGIARKRGGTSYYGPPVAASVPMLVDSSSKNHPIVAHGDAHIDIVTKKFGAGSVAFDGTGDYLTLDGSSDFSPGTGDFTVDFWLYANAYPAVAARLYDCRVPAGGGMTVSNKFGETFFPPGSPSTYTTHGLLTPSNNNLYLCSVVLQENKTVTGITGCGLTWVKVAEFNNASGVYTTVFRALKGSGLSSGNLVLTFSGNLTEFACVAVDEASGVDTSGTDGSGAIVQSATIGGSGTSKEVTLAAYASPSNHGFGAFGSLAVTLSASNSFIQLKSLKSGTGVNDHSAITMHRATTGNPKATEASGSTQWAAVGLEIAAFASAAQTITLGPTGKVSFSTLESGVLSTGAWHHIAVTRSGTNVRLFTDGSLIGTITDATNYQAGSSRPVIGASGATEGTEALNGYVDELRVSNNARWTAGFTPAAAAYTDDANTMLLMHADASTTNATALRAVKYADFPSGAQIVATADDSHAYLITSTTATDLGDVGPNRISPICKPALHVSGTSRLILPGSDGTTAPYAYTGTTLAALGGSPPAGKIVGIYKARVLLANSNANPNRLWFSPLDPSTTWDTTNAWVDLDHPITGIQAIRNSCLIFSAGHTDYLTGSVPPGTQGFDMSLGPLFDIGCSDGRSIGVWQDNVIFANADGVFLTNGAAPRSLTEPPEFGGLGIGSYWRSLLSGYRAGWQLHGDVLGNYYVVTVRNDTDGLIDTLMCHLPRRAWWRLAHFDAGMYSAATGNAQELYFASRSSAQVVTVSGIFTPTAANKNDATGEPVEPVFESRFYGTGPTLKAYGFGRFTWDMRDAATDNPTMQVELASGAEATAFAGVPESPFSETGDADRQRITLNKDAQGVTLRFTQAGASAKTELYAVEIEERGYEETIDGED